MALFEWNDRYSVGVARFDRQHKQLFDLFNSLHDSVRKGHTRTALADAFQQMVDYTEFHLADEERAMRLVDYVEVEAHCEEHNKLRAELWKFQKRFQEGETNIGVEFITFLLRWWTDHILRTDYGYKSYFFARQDITLLI